MIQLFSSSQVEEEVELLVDGNGGGSVEEQVVIEQLCYRNALFQFQVHNLIQLQYGAGAAGCPA
jgi:hypothetical protein